MLKLFPALIICFTLTLCSCTNTDNSKNNTGANAKQMEKQDTFPVKELVVDKGEEEGWGGDIRLSIVSASETDTSRNYKAISNYEGKHLGIELSVPKSKEGSKGFSKGIIIKSIGSESDNLLRTLAKLYKQKPDTSLKFVNVISVTYVNLKEFAKSLTGQEGESYTMASEYKLFFEGKGENDYAELYVNVNPDEHWIEIKEKDDEYRPALIKFFKNK
jgi:hypothetical protein